MKSGAICFLALLTAAQVLFAQAQSPRPECWVWLMGGLGSDAAYAKATNIATRAAASGYTAIAIKAGDTFCSTPETKARAKAFAECLHGLGMDMIPVIWGMGYGGDILKSEPEFVETSPERGMRFRVSGARASFVPTEIATGLEGQVFTNLALNLDGGKIKAYRSYALTCRIRTQDLEPLAYYSVRGNMWHGSGETELHDIPVKATQDWTAHTWTFSTFSSDSLSLQIKVPRYLKVKGTCWIDSVKLVERAPTSWLTTDPEMKPVVRSAATGVTYVEGRDYKLPSKGASPTSAKPLEIEIVSGGTIRDGEELIVDANVPVIQGSRQYSICPSASGLKDYFRRTARSIEETIHPKRWFFAVDEWRTANQCAKCRARNVTPGRLMGECVADMVAVVRELNPAAEVCGWYDMFCPLSNAGDSHFYCVQGDMRDSWTYLPKDFIMVPWGHSPKTLKAMDWLMDHGFRCMAAGFYNKPDLSADIAWRDHCKGNKNFLGMMFTTWGGVYGTGSYDKLEDFGRMVNEEQPHTNGQIKPVK